MDETLDRERPAPESDRHLLVLPHLYAWRGNGIVLLGEQVGDRWVISRGWLADDTMTSVRRWSFAAAGPFCGQVRRLVWDATSDADLAREQGLEALAWSEALA